MFQKTIVVIQLIEFLIFGQGGQQVQKRIVHQLLIQRLVLGSKMVQILHIEQEKQFDNQGISPQSRANQALALNQQCQQGVVSLYQEKTALTAIVKTKLNQLIAGEFQARTKETVIFQFDSQSDLFDNERELLSQHNPDVLVSSKRQLLADIRNNSKPRKDSDNSTIMRMQSSKKDLITPKKENNSVVNVVQPQILINSQKRKSKVQQQGTLESQSEKSHFIKQQMKKLVKSYLNRSQTQQNEDNKSPTNDYDKKQSKQTTKDISGTNKFSYLKLENKSDPPILQDESFTENQEKENLKKKYRFLIKVNGNYRIRWDLFVMMLSIWNCYSLPFDVAFQPETFNHLFFEYLNTFIDICFGLDIVFNFRTTFLNRQTGDEVTSTKIIALEYLKSKFWIDIIATVPLDQLFQGVLETNQTKKLQLFSMLKLLRVLRLSKIITYMNATDEIKLSLKLFKMLFFLVMYLHCQACAWFYITALDETWIPPVNMAYNNNQFYQDDVASQYFMALYTSLLILYGGDLFPRGNLQLGFLSLAFILSALINANILGTIAVIIQTLNRRASRFQEQIDIANTAMKNMKLPEDLQRKVQDFMMYTQSNLDYQKQLDMFLNMISPSLRLQVTQHIFLIAISKNIIFKGNQELIRFVVHNIITLLYLPEDIIIRQDTKAHHIFFLAQGTCEVWVRDQFRRETFVRNLLQGMLFGEVALIAQVKRTASVKSKNYCTLAALNDENFYEMCHQFPDIFFKMKQETQKYNDKWKIFQKKIISSIEYFANLSEDLKEELHYKLSLEYFEKDTEIFSTGDSCDALYFIVDGEIDLVIHQQDDEELQLDTLYTGCSIGSYSLIQQQKYPYTARARNSVTLLVLSRADLYEAVDVIEELNYALWDAEEFINNNGVPMCDYTIYRAIWRNNNEQPKPLQKFQNAVRRIRILNQRNKFKQIKFLDLIDKLRDNLLMNKYGSQAMKKPSLTLKASNLRSKHSLAPFIQKHLVNQIKNKTADHGVRRISDHNKNPQNIRDQAVVTKLTFKIESLSDHIKKQNKQMLTMQRLFNQKLNNLIDSKNTSKNPSSYSSQLRTDDEYGSDRNGSERSRKRNRRHKDNLGIRTQPQNTQHDFPGLSLHMPHNQGKDNLLMPVRNQTTSKYKKKFKLQQPTDKLSSQKEKFKSLQLETLNKQSHYHMLEQKRSMQIQQNELNDMFNDIRRPLSTPILSKNPSYNSSRAGSGGKSGKASNRYRNFDDQYAAGQIWEDPGATNENFNHQDSQETLRSGLIQKAKVIQNFSQLNQVLPLNLTNLQKLNQEIQQKQSEEQSVLNKAKVLVPLLLDLNFQAKSLKQNSALPTPNFDQLKLTLTQNQVSKKLSESRIVTAQKDPNTLSTLDKIQQIGLMSSQKHQRNQSDPFLKINLDQLLQQQQFQQQIINKMQGKSGNNSQQSVNSHLINNRSKDSAYYDYQRNHSKMSNLNVNHSRKQSESKSHSNKSLNSARSKRSQRELYEEYKKDLEIEKRIQSKFGKVIEQKHNEQNQQQKLSANNLGQSEMRVQDQDSKNERKLSTQELIIQKMTQQKPQTYQSQFEAQLPSMQPPTLTKHKSSMKEDNPDKSQQYEVKKKVQIQQPPVEAYSLQLQKLFDSHQKEKSLRSSQQINSHNSQQPSTEKRNTKTQSSNQINNHQKASVRDESRNQTKKSSDKNLNQKIERMTTKEINQVIDEEQNKGELKKRKTNRNQTIREQNKKIDELLEKHFQEDIGFQDEYLDEKAELESRLENIEEEDVDYEYYYDEI
eukprot:403337973